MSSLAIDDEEIIENVLYIANIVCNAMFDGTRFDIINIAEYYGCDLKKKQFPAVAMRFSNTPGTLCLFRPGSAVVTRCKSPQDALRIIYLFLRDILKKFKFSSTEKIPSLKYFYIRNIVTSVYIGYEINLALFYQDHTQRCYYHPLNFSGLHYLADDGTELTRNQSITYVMFQPGKFVMTGGKDFNQMQIIHNRMKNVFLKYKLGHEYRKFDFSIQPHFSQERKFIEALGKNKKKGKRKQNQTDHDNSDADFITSPLAVNQIINNYS